MASPSDFRKLCLALPEAEEVETWDHPTFRVRNKMFAAMGSGARNVTASLKCDPAERDALVAQGDPWFVPDYVGRFGWLGVKLGPKVSVGELRELVTDSWRRTAPKKLVEGFRRPWSP